ncbi:hypothetical protein GE061_015058 [Apolygus lucorum]|uniref:Uncharacterized protein n=1 Tax=Apolygus lucorum TaxID=248454 RepID=A0A8S9XLZ9_APOLU|nr:hypothetical protein GE061_015058 [Apolygus lucorum]
MAKEGTPARELLDSFPPSSDNYEKAVTLLKNRFGRDELLVELYVRELLNLVLMQSSGKTSISLSQLFDRLETQLMALESLGVASEKYASMLYPMVESSLPEAVLREWERKRVKSDKGLLLEAAERMAELRLFLKAEVESEERLSLARNSFSSSAKSTPSDKQEKGRKPDTTTPKVSTAADLVHFQTHSNPERCLFCGGDHPGQFCFRARQMNKPPVTGSLHVAEIDRAERVVLRMIQEESFSGVKDKSLSKLKPQVDSNGLIRLRTKIWARKDTEDFRAPVILPPRHDLVSKLILDLHREMVTLLVRLC